MAKKGPSVTLADGEKPQPVVPGPAPTLGDRAKDAAITGGAVLMSAGPIRRAARWLFITIGGLFWDRNRRAEDRKTGRQTPG